MLMLLPLLAPSLQMQAPATTQEVEAALTLGVREKLADGWSLVDIRGDYDELTITVAKGTQVEAHVAHVDGSNNAYRVDAGIALPSERIAPQPFVLQALMTNGGLAIGNDCGRIEARPYLLHGKAKGAAAGRLVAKTLKQSRDVEGAHVEGDLATFLLEMSDNNVQLHVTLESENVVAAEIREYDYFADVSTYKKQRTMKKRLGSTVTAIAEDGLELKLWDGSKYFTIDANDYQGNHGDGPHAGGSCGC